MLTRRVRPLVALSLACLVAPACGDDSAASTASSATTGGSATTGDSGDSGSSGASGASDASTTDATTADASSTTAAGDADVTWYQHVQPIIAERCWACHSAEGALSFSLETYDVAQQFAPLMLEKIVGSDSPPYYMPPFLARESAACTPEVPWRDDPRLSDAEIATLEAWIAAGKPEGDPADAAPIPDWKPEALGGDTLATIESAGYTLAADVKEDQYRCFSLGTALDAPVWLTGLQVNPGDPAVVHHVVLFSDPNGDSAALAQDEGSYPCFGGAGVQDSSVLYAWAPGGNPLELPTDAGIPLQPGERVVMQVHYHPTGAATTDKTSLTVRWTDAKPAREALMAIIGGVHIAQTNSKSWDDPPFLIPAGAENHVETWRETLNVPPADIRIWSIFPHMHLVGASMEVTLEHDGAEACLAPLPHWDFDWQRTYVYDAPFSELPRVQNGDVLKVRCTYNNSLSNQGLAKALAEEGIGAPIDMQVGEDTLDEMCVAIVGIMY
ncbi:MAG: hypothetical protein R3A79_16675 [Nannocystaceae bacterium]